MKFIKENIGLSFYTFVLIILCFGVIWISDFKHINKLLIIVGSTYSSYFIFKKFLPFDRISFKFPQFNFSDRKVIYGLVITAVIIFAFDVFFSKGLPILQLNNISTISELNDLRANVYAFTPKLQVYFSNWNLKAILPLTLIILHLKGEKKLFYFLLILSCFYAFSMMQKSYILNLLMPLIILLFVKKEFIKAGTLILVSLTVIISLIAIATEYKEKTAILEREQAAILAKEILLKEQQEIDNIKSESAIVPEQASTDSPDVVVVETPKEAPKGVVSDVVIPVIREPGDMGYSAPVNVVIGITKRIMVVPGEMVSGWFDIIPEHVPYLYGDGYSLIAKIKGNKFHDYSSELYPFLRPSFVKRGLKGTVNVASFMRGYSNFGVPGLILSCFSISFFLCFLEHLFQGNKKMFVALNSYPILLLSSGNLLTLLLSGGWMITILMMILFHKQIDEKRYSVT